MENPGLARFAAGCLSVLGAVAGLLWAAYVLYGLVTGSGVVEPVVFRIFGFRSMKLDALIAGLGAVVYLLADRPRQWLKAREKAGARAGGAAQTARPHLGPAHPPAPGQADRFRLVVEHGPPHVPGSPSTDPAGPGQPPPRPQGPGRDRGRAGIALAVLLALIGMVSWYSAYRPHRDGPTTSPATASTSPSADPGAAEEEFALLKAVVQAQNGFDPAAHQSGRAYAREFGVEAKVKRSSRPLVSPIGLEAEKSLERLAAALQGRPGGGALQKLAGAYVAAARSLPGPVGEAERYYGRGAQNEDGWARGQALHVRLRAAFRDYFVAAEALSAEARRVGQERRAGLRAKLAANGSVRRLSTLDAVDRGRAVVDLLERRSARRDLDQATMSGALASLEATVDDLQRLAKDTAGTQRELGQDPAVAYGSLAQRAEHLLRSARAFERRTRTAPRPVPETREGGANVDDADARFRQDEARLRDLQKTLDASNEHRERESLTDAFNAVVWEANRVFP